MSGRLNTMQYCLSLPFVIFMKRQAPLTRFSSAQIRGFKSRTSNYRTDIRWQWPFDEFAPLWGRLGT